MAHRQRELGIGQRRELVADDARRGQAPDPVRPRRGRPSSSSPSRSQTRDDSSAAALGDDAGHVGEDVGRGGGAGHAVGQLGQHLVGRGAVAVHQPLANRSARWRTGANPMATMAVAATESAVFGPEPISAPRPTGSDEVDDADEPSQRARARRPGSRTAGAATAVTAARRSRRPRP